MEKTENNVMFNTPGTSPMYEMLLFIHHWSEDFPTKSMKDSFIKKTQILLTRESKVIHAAFEAGMKASVPNPEYYKESFKSNRMSILDIEEEKGYRDELFIGLNPEE
jgi:hypothetical protein